MPPTDAERALILAAQKEWDRRKDEIRLNMQNYSMGVSVDDANEAAGMMAIRELGDRPGGAGILPAIVQVLTLVGLGIALLPGTMTALTTPEILSKLRKLYDGLRNLSVVPDGAGIILSGVKGLAGMDKLNAVEGVRIAHATTNAIFTKVEEALKGDGKIDKNEIMGVVTAAIGAAWAEASDGDSV